jgi:hypothetical protein
VQSEASARWGEAEDLLRSEEKGMKTEGLSEIASRRLAWGLVPRVFVDAFSKGQGELLWMYNF